MTDKKVMQKFRNTLRGKFGRWKESAKRRSIPFNISLDDIEKIPMKCFYTGIDLDLKSGKFNTVSLDRIDSNGAYDKDNIVICCKQINIMKQDLSVDIFIEYCEKIGDKKCLM